MAGHIYLPIGTRFIDSDGYAVVVVDPQFASLWGNEYDVRERIIRPTTDPVLQQNPFVRLAQRNRRPIHDTYTTRRVIPLLPPPPPPPASAAGDVEPSPESSIDLTAGEDLTDYYEEIGWNVANP